MPLDIEGSESQSEKRRSSSVLASTACAALAATSNASKLRKFAMPTFRARHSNSQTKPVTEISDVSFNMAMNWLPIGGITRRRACGSTTRRMIWMGTMPTAIAASRCPMSTDWMPARKISVM